VKQMLEFLSLAFSNPYGLKNSRFNILNSVLNAMHLLSRHYGSFKTDSFCDLACLDIFSIIGMSLEQIFSEKEHEPITGMKNDLSTE